ncbi:MOXD1 2 isoform X1 [Vespula maculifrons]|uniref:MOXD1 2 isoform X1 n=1 Tax=Vespula maculifrons TaxID=7453 RepID=A0ABD2CBQ9_VESMC
MKDVSKDPEVDSSQDYRLLLGYENKTHTVLRFSRRYDTCDSRDLKITKSEKFQGDTLRLMDFPCEILAFLGNWTRTKNFSILENSRLLPGARWSSSFALNPLECSVDEAGEEEAVGAWLRGS